MAYGRTELVAPIDPVVMSGEVVHEWRASRSTGLTLEDLEALCLVARSNHAPGETHIAEVAFAQDGDNRGAVQTLVLRGRTEHRNDGQATKKPGYRG